MTTEINDIIPRSIRHLSSLTISRIAAGEVVERPASAVKELVENAIDGQATEIVVKIEAGGKNLISIVDNGCGMNKDDLSIAVQSHTTSKLIADDLLNINFFGFRGEALHSIAAISRMSIKSRPDHLKEGSMIRIEGGKVIESSPCPHHKGTTVEVRDLFYATPARLKFLRTDRSEIQAIVDVLTKIALANSSVTLKLYSNDRQLLDFNALQKCEEDERLDDRISKVLKKDFIENCIKVKSKDEGIKVHGYISLPTYDRGTSTDLYLFVNKRPVRDKFLLSAVRVAYQDFISRDRYPVIVLFLEVDNNLVDVNAHPAKTEVRFRDISAIRSIVVGSLKNALYSHGDKTSSTIANKTLKLASVESLNSAPSALSHSSANSLSFARKLDDMEAGRESGSGYKSNNNSTFAQNKQYALSSRGNSFINESINSFNAPSVKHFEESVDDNKYTNNKLYKLGAARCQLHETYIISQTEDSIVIVDQHAAHERLEYEDLKNKIYAGAIEKQRLLIPEIIDVNMDVMEKIEGFAEDLYKLGLKIERCTPQSIIVTEIPHMLSKCNPKKLLQDIIDDIKEFDKSINFQEMLNHVLATYACHHSIRSGRKMNAPEMNELLRKMENTSHSGQCNHGRPTYIELKLKNIEKLFGR